MTYILTVILALASGIIPGGRTWLEPLQPRDSVLVADQFEYGFRMDSVAMGTTFMLQDLAEYPLFKSDSVALVRGWEVDTLKRDKGLLDLNVSVVVAPFEEGTITLPTIAVRRELASGRVDTLLFDPSVIEVTPIPVDTATFVIRDIKGQMKYPLTFRELLPWVLGVLLLAALTFALAYFVRRRRRMHEDAVPDEPPYLTALRRLERYRDVRYENPALQKEYYSGITDALKTYIAARFDDVDALEMTTAELFTALKSHSELTPALYSDAKELFELADFVKFAKHKASPDENRKSMQTAVGFVTSTYQTQLEEEQKSDVL